MPKPIVAIVGRPNVGKSTLVNRLAEARDAIVHESRGVTRDRSYHTTDWNGRSFVLVDTGGIESIKSTDSFAPRIREQALAACDEADVIIFVVDGSVGVTDEDEEVARILRKGDKPVFLMVNKCDDPDHEDEKLWEFWSLGIGEPMPLSALHGHGTGDLLDEIVAALPEETDDEDDVVEDLSIAIIGRPNVGKSSLTNRLLGANRSIVSDVAGTTRDAIYSFVDHSGTISKSAATAPSSVYAKMQPKSVSPARAAIYTAARSSPGGEKSRKPTCRPSRCACSKSRRASVCSSSSRFRASSDRRHR